MIFRAVFWIGLIALLAPHEPDIGLGRPGGDVALASMMKSWAVTGHAQPASACEETCDSGAGASTPPERSLADVKAEINASIKARGGLSYAL